MAMGRAGYGFSLNVELFQIGRPAIKGAAQDCSS
ncbi:rCG25024, partial [Rattus norvegicus]